MGDRANVYVKDFDPDQGTYLYTHWAGTDLPEIVQSALARRERWDDNPYLTRIIFCEMVKGQEAEATSFGISATVGDGDDRVIVVDPNTQTVYREGGGTEPLTFEQFVSDPDPSWDSI